LVNLGLDGVSESDIMICLPPESRDSRFLLKSVASLLLLGLEFQVLESLEDGHRSSLSGNGAGVDAVLACWSEHHDVVVVNIAELEVRALTDWSIMNTLKVDQALFATLELFSCDVTNYRHGDGLTAVRNSASIVGASAVLESSERLGIASILGVQSGLPTSSVGNLVQRDLIKVHEAEAGLRSATHGDIFNVSSGVSVTLEIGFTIRVVEVKLGVEVDQFSVPFGLVSFLGCLAVVLLSSFLSEVEEILCLELAEANNT